MWAPHAEDFAYVVAEFAYVGSAFAANFEKNVSSVCLHEVYVVDASGSELPLNRRPQGWSLINFVFKLAEDLF